MLRMQREHMTSKHFDYKMYTMRLRLPDVLERQALALNLLSKRV